MKGRLRFGDLQSNRQQCVGDSRGCKLTSEVLQELNLSQRSLGEDLLAENIGDFLDCDPLTGLRIVRGA